MKAIILTSAAVNDSEQKLLQKTNIFKLALNHHAKELNPNARIITDYVLPKIYNKFPTDKIISVRERLRYPSKRVEYFDGEFKGATILSAIDYLILNNFNKILIVGTNKVNGDEFCNLVNNEIDKIIHKVLIFQYTKGYFNLPIMSITDFIK